MAGGVLLHKYTSMRSEACALLQSAAADATLRTRTDGSAVPDVLELSHTADGYAHRKRPGWSFAQSCTVFAVGTLSVPTDSTIALRRSLHNLPPESLRLGSPEAANFVVETAGASQPQLRPPPLACSKYSCETWTSVLVTAATEGWVHTQQECRNHDAHSVVERMRRVLRARPSPGDPTESMQPSESPRTQWVDQQWV
jgi:hypothetical protein